MLSRLARSVSERSNSSRPVGSKTPRGWKPRERRIASSGRVLRMEAQGRWVQPMTGHGESGSGRGRPCGARPDRIPIADGSLDSSGSFLFWRGRLAGHPPPFRFERLTVKERLRRYRRNSSGSTAHLGGLTGKEKRYRPDSDGRGIHGHVAVSFGTSARREFADYVRPHSAV